MMARLEALELAFKGTPLVPHYHKVAKLVCTYGEVVCQPSKMSGMVQVKRQPLFCFVCVGAHMKRNAQHCIR